MSEEEKLNAGIHELSYDFGCRITRLFQYLTEDAEYKEFVQSLSHDCDRILKILTSIVKTMKEKIGSR